VTGPFAAAALSLAPICGGNGGGEETATPTATPKVEKPLDPRHFLDLPFPSSREMKLVQGWIYEGREVPDGTEHRAIDFVEGTDPNQSSTWKNFPILTAAGGFACQSSFESKTYGRDYTVRVIHPNGYETRYLHLKSGSTPNDMPDCSVDKKDWEPVERGEQIGEAGDSGTNPGWDHLHLEVRDQSGEPVDPYDIYGRKGLYPDPNFTNGKTCGPEYLWTYCPTGQVLGEATTATPEAIEGVNREFGLALVQAINDLRNLRKLAAWDVNSTLTKIAEEYSQYLMDRKVYDVVNQVPEEVKKEVIDNLVSINGYEGEFDVTFVPGQFSPDPSEAKSTFHNGWGESPEMDNIFLNPDFDEVGVGCIFQEYEEGTNGVCVVVAGGPKEYITETATPKPTATVEVTPTRKELIKQKFQEAEDKARHFVDLLLAGTGESLQEAYAMQVPDNLRGEYGSYVLGIFGSYGTVDDLTTCSNQMWLGEFQRPEFVQWQTSAKEDLTETDILNIQRGLAARERYVIGVNYTYSDWFIDYGRGPFSDYEFLGDDSYFVFEDVNGELLIAKNNFCFRSHLQILAGQPSDE